jgi:Fe-S-cluster containining protein
MPYNAPKDRLEETPIFSCKKCGTCCRGYGGTFVTDADIERIAAYTGNDPETFVEKFCHISGGKPVLAQQENGFCIFWDEVCTIHPVKPRMCREWPFIRSVLVDPVNWRIMAASCPGIQKDVSIRLVQEYIRNLNPAVSEVNEF